MEEWLPIADYEGLYEVSDHGRVRRLTTFVDRPPSRRHPQGFQQRVPGGILSPGRSGPYVTVALCKNGKQTSLGVHQLVCRSFNGPRPTLRSEVCHRDDDGLNNVPSNLYWGDRFTNMADAVRNGHHYNANKTHCPQGHEYTPENIRKSTKGRSCKKCHAEESNRRYHAHEG